MSLTVVRRVTRSLVNRPVSACHTRASLARVVSPGLLREHRPNATPSVHMWPQTQSGEQAGNNYSWQVRTDRQEDRQAASQEIRQADRQRASQSDRQKIRQAGSQTGRKSDRQTAIQSDRQEDSQAGRQTANQISRKTDTETGRQTASQSDRQEDRH